MAGYVAAEASTPAARDRDHLVARHDLDAGAARGLTEAELVLVEAVPAVEVVYSTPRASSRAGIDVGSGCSGLHQFAWSLIRWPMVSIASDLVWPIRPTGPRLIQPVA